MVYADADKLEVRPCSSCTASCSKTKMLTSILLSAGLHGAALARASPASSALRVAPSTRLASCTFTRRTRRRAQAQAHQAHGSTCRRARDALARPRRAGRRQAPQRPVRLARSSRGYALPHAQARRQPRSSDTGASSSSPQPPRHAVPRFGDHARLARRLDLGGRHGVARHLGRAYAECT